MVKIFTLADWNASFWCFFLFPFATIFMHISRYAAFICIKLCKQTSSSSKWSLMFANENEIVLARQTCSQNSQKEFKILLKLKIFLSLCFDWRWIKFNMNTLGAYVGFSFILFPNELVLYIVTLDEEQTWSFFAMSNYLLSPYIRIN